MGAFEIDRHPFGVVVVVCGEGLLLGGCIDLHSPHHGPGLGLGPWELADSVAVRM
jgi:hypothetical protein